MEIDQNILNTIHEIYFPTLKNTENKDGDSFFILFSSVPGAGKTTISTHLEEELSVVRINNDDIRKVIKVLFPEFDEKTQQQYLLYYLQYLLKYLKSIGVNSFILDASIDRTFDQAVGVIEKMNSKYVVISCEVSQSILKERWMNRKMTSDWYKDISMEKMLNDLENYVTEHKLLTDKRNHFFIEVDCSKPVEINSLIIKIKEKLSA